MRNKIWGLALLLVTTASITACNKDDEGPVIKNFSGTLSGANEVPPNASAGTGTASFSFNSDTKILSGTVTYSGFTAIAAHIHTGAAGVAGPVLFDLGAVLTSPISFTSGALDATQEADLMNGLLYVNIHSAIYPGGEIRSQLTSQ